MKSCDMVVWPDIHSPFHHRPSVNLAFKVTEYVKPDIFAQVGDFADGNCAKRHPGTSQYETLLKELAAGPIPLRERIDAMCTRIGVRRKIITLGNHDEWAQARVKEKTPFLEGIVDIDREIGFTANGWEVTSYTDFTTVGKLHLTHDWGSAGHKAAIDAQKDVNGNSVFGHNHSAVIAYGGDMLGQKHVSASLGWLGDPNKAKYMYRHKKNRDWMHGIGLVHFTASGDAHVQFIPFIRGVAVVDRKEIRL